MVNVSKPKPPGDNPPERLVKAVVGRSLLIRDIPADAGPGYEGQFELVLVGSYRDPKTNEIRVGGGITLHTGSKAECEQMLIPSVTVLTMFGAEIVNGLMDLVEAQVAGTKIIKGAVSKTILNASGFAARCESCGKPKPCGCISAKRRRP